jgi:hypothetical protein
MAAAAKGILSKVPPERSFWLCTNENLRSLTDLSNALDKATNDVFRYHVNRDKNDFETWIRDELMDKDLAREIARVKTKETLLRKISERLEELQKIIKRSKPVKKVKRVKKTKKVRKVKKKKSKKVKISRKSSKKKAKGKKNSRRVNRKKSKEQKSSKRKRK